ASAAAAATSGLDPVSAPASRWAGVRMRRTVVTNITACRDERPSAGRRGLWRSSWLLDHDAKQSMRFSTQKPRFCVVRMDALRRCGKADTQRSAARAKVPRPGAAVEFAVCAPNIVKAQLRNLARIELPPDRPLKGRPKHTARSAPAHGGEISAACRRVSARDRPAARSDG